LADNIDHLSRHWAIKREEASEQSVGKAFTIVLSREAGTQATALAHELKKRLGWDVYGHELLELIAREMGLQTDLLDSLDEKRQSWLTETFEALRVGFSKANFEYLVSGSAYLHNLVKTVLALGAHGNCIIVGRGAAFILPPESTFRVRLLAPFKDRVMLWSKRLGVSEAEAARQVRTIDRQRSDFIRDAFGKDPADVQFYDLSLNISRLPLESRAEIIVTALRELQAARGQQPAQVSA
jgi:cytidylate kinase